MNRTNQGNYCWKDLSISKLICCFFITWMVLHSPSVIWGQTFPAGPGSVEQPDLMISSFMIRPSSISKNGSAVIFLEVRNERKTPSPPTRIEYGGEVKVKYFFGIPDSMAIPAIGGKQTWSHHFHRIHPDEFFPRPGDFTITATVNPRGRDFPEPNLTNNTQSLLVRVEDLLEANVPPPSLKKQMEQKIQREHILENMPPQPPTVMPRPGPPPPSGK